MSTLSHSVRLERISSLKLHDVCTVQLTDSISSVVQLMVSRGAGCALVMDGNLLAGIFTERDFLNRVVARNIDTARWIHEVMTTEPKTIDQHATVLTAINVMEAGGYQHLAVVAENRRPIGVLCAQDIVRHLVEVLALEPYNPSPTAAQPQLARGGH